MDSSSGRDFTMGVYPMLPDETCWFLAADFDKASWQQDAGAFLETCNVCTQRLSGKMDFW
jgi:hypothetical protein